MPPTRIPTPADFTSIYSSHPAYHPSSSASSSSSSPPISLVFPSPAESTTSILLLFHGLGDSEAPFASFARNLSLPGVLSISVRGVSPLPALVAGDGEGQGYHWGDDLGFTAGGEIDPDPGFGKARTWVMEKLVGEVLVQKCGWEMGDIMLFGFGQGGTLALGLASMLRMGAKVEEVGSGTEGRGLGDRKRFKGVVSVGGGLPASMVPSMSGLGKAKTPVLVCCGRESEAVDEDAVDVLEREFEEVKVVRWKRSDDGMPRNREEVLPMMQFFAERLRNGWL
ncbi:hypothetical protein VTI74DRAFT_8387 [Chaetomium olivicolor]